MLNRWLGSFALASFSLLAAGCLAAPPFIASYSEPETTGTRLAVGRSVSFVRWGANCEIRVEPTSVTLTRDDESAKIDAFISADGVFVRWPSEQDENLEIDRGTGAPILWDDDEFHVADCWYDLDDEGPFEWSAPLARVHGELDQYSSFALGSVWMSTDSSNLDLHVGRETRVIEDAVGENSLSFQVEDLELPQVRFTLGDGRTALWVGENLWIDGEFQPRGR
ncbi:MAG: hypothetical protein AAF196_16020 [Planctomycetota bacterium]